MNIIHDYGLVRIVSEGLDLIVQFKRSPESEWEFYSSYNEMSDDWAHTHARESAGRAIKSVAAEMAAKITAWHSVVNQYNGTIQIDWTLNETEIS